MPGLHSTFSALGDATRFAIVERLLKEGELSAGHLQQGLKVSPPAVSRHLKVLHQAGVIERRIDKQRRLYSIRPKALQAISDWTISHQEFWQASLDRLEIALTKETQENE